MEGKADAEMIDAQKPRRNVIESLPDMGDLEMMKRIAVIQQLIKDNDAFRKIGQKSLRYIFKAAEMITADEPTPEVKEIIREYGDSFKAVYQLANRMYAKVKATDSDSFWRKTILDAGLITDTGRANPWKDVGK